MEDEVKKVCADNQIAEWMRVWIPYNDEPGGVEVSQSRNVTSTLIGPAARSELATQILDKISDLIYLKF